VLQFERFASHFFPKAILMENVAGLARDKRLASLARHLRTLGYEVDWRIIDAADFGVPQRRRRLVLMGSRVEPPDFPSPSETRKTVRDAIGAIRPPGSSRDPLHDIVEHRSEKVRNLISRIPKDGGSRASLGPEGQLDCHRSFDGFHDVYGRMSWDDVSPTITSGCVNPSKGRFLHPEQDRAITLREAALLQGFPKRYKFSLRKGKFAAAEMIGNALPPPFVEAHARVLARIATAGNAR
jgi:DNA (cytosine-5)-methyltransferase 1